MPRATLTVDDAAVRRRRRCPFHTYRPAARQPPRARSCSDVDRSPRGHCRGPGDLRAIQAGSRVVGLVALSKATGANDGGIWVETSENVRVTHSLVANNTNPLEASNSDDIVLICNVVRASSAVFSILLLSGISTSWRAPIESTFATAACATITGRTWRFREVSLRASRRDAIDGETHLKRRWFMPPKRVLDLKWSVESSEGIFNATQAMHKGLTETTGGRSLPNPLWRPLKNLRTLHPLGGCVMGASPETGVVGRPGWTSGYPNPIVADGAIVPTPRGRESFAHERSARGAHRR